MKNYIQIAKVIVLSIVATVFLVELVHDPGEFIGRWISCYHRLSVKFNKCRIEYYKVKKEYNDVKIYKWMYK